MDSIVNQVKDLFAQADEQGRKELQDELRDLQYSLDTERDVGLRIGAALSLARVGVDLHLFEKLVASEKPLSLKDLTAELSADPQLLGHLLRASAAFGLIKESSKDEFAANRLSRVLADKKLSASMPIFDLHAPVALALPSYLRNNSYTYPTSITDLPFHVAFPTPLTPFEWLKQHPEHMAAMGHAMALADPTSWLSVFPLADQLSKLTFQEADTLLVDMGGGFGQQAKAFVAKLHELEDVDTRLLKGEVIVQEIPQTLEHAPKDSMGFTFQVHDFFTPQPVKGAKFYYLRHILHDWSDEDCVRILENIVPAMGPESKVVIDEVVLPDEGVPWQAAYSDLIMLASLGGRERTKGEYEELLGKVGLRVEGVWRYDGRMQSALLAVKK